MKKNLAISILFSLLFSTSLRAEAEWSYTVRPGDNLWIISQKYLHSIDYWLKLATYNKIEEPKRLPPGTILRVPVAWLKNPPQSVSVLLVFGVVELQRAFQTTTQKNIVRLEPGMRINVNDKLIAKQGSALLELADGSQLRILPNSEIVFNVLTAYEKSGMVDTRIRLERGRIKSKVPKLKYKKSRYEIITPAAVISIRGTEFRVAMDVKTQQMFTEVEEGKVVVANDKGQQQVDDGYGIRLKPGELPQPPVKLLPATKIKHINMPIVSSSQHFNWASIQGAEKYRASLLKWVSSAAFDKGASYVQIKENVIHETNFNYDGLESGLYKLIVKGISPQGMSGLPAQMDISVQPLDAPELKVKQDGKNVRISWQRQDVADAYQIKIVRQTLLGAKEEVITQSSTEYTFSLTGTGYHRITVQALVDNQAGKKSEMLELAYQSSFYEAFKRLAPFFVLAPLL